jgi:hypothetical protein
MKLLDPFRKLPMGYYRLFLTAWILVPSIVAMLLYFILSFFATRNSPDASDFSIKWFFILLIIYYPIARFSLWVWHGFQKGRNTESNNGDEIQISKLLQVPILAVKRHDNMTGELLFVERIINGETHQVEQAIITCEHGDFWLPSSIVGDDHTVVNLTAVTTYKAETTGVEKKMTQAETLELLVNLGAKFTE